LERTSSSLAANKYGILKIHHRTLDALVQKQCLTVDAGNSWWNDLSIVEHADFRSTHGEIYESQNDV
jgi:hypothetical protein